MVAYTTNTTPSFPVSLPKPTTTLTTTPQFHRFLLPFHHHKHHNRWVKVRSSKSSNEGDTSSSSRGRRGSMITEFDLYDLLGIDSNSNQAQIKAAYRSLQKRCHPDIAGADGHDMAIILNQIYALLSDPISRSLYDKEHAKIAEMRGYTGKPMYSVWKGSETEERAVFVDEVRCVGCLKCALFADNTFAIESTHGRARVVAQWADPEPKIQESIDSCPVNCISFVNRKDLAALEFLMSKQPRGSLRIGGSNPGDKRVVDVFTQLNAFQKRLEDTLSRQSSPPDSEYSTLESNARTSAIQAIKSISNWLYWKPPGSKTSSNLTLFKGAKTFFDQPDLKKLREAAKRIATQNTKNKTSLLSSKSSLSKDEYWVRPSSIPSSQTTIESSVQPTSIPQKPSYKGDQNPGYKSKYKRKIKQRSPFSLGVPVGFAVIGVIFAKLHEADSSVGALGEHIGGSIALQAVNSSWSQACLAGITWYVVGIILVQFVESFASRGES